VSLPVFVRAAGIARRAPSDFLPAILQLQEDPPSPLPRAVLWAVLAIVALFGAWAVLGRLDVVAVADGRLVPRSQLRVVQPAEGGVLRELVVREGERVKAGQVLARMDVRAAETDAAATEAELALRRLQLRRIEAELRGAPLARLDSDPPGAYEQVNAQHEARVHALEERLAEERALIATAGSEMQVSLETRTKLAGTLPVLREQEQAFERLARDGYAGRLMLAQRSRERLEAEQDLRAQEHRIASARAAIEQAERRLQRLYADYRAQLQGERIETERALSRLSQELEKLEHRRSLAELRAPADGVVKDLATHAAGAVLAPGTVLMTLVPEGEALVAEVWLANRDAGFVREGQDVRLKLASYPFQKYGLLDGRVLRVSADSSERGATEPGRPGVSFAYRAQIELLAQELIVAGERHALLPGMQLAAEIRIGERSVLEYLLSPIQGIAQEAGRER